MKTLIAALCFSLSVGYAKADDMDVYKKLSETEKQIYLIGYVDSFMDLEAIRRIRLPNNPTFLKSCSQFTELEIVQLMAMHIRRGNYKSLGIARIEAFHNVCGQEVLK